MFQCFGHNVNRETDLSSAQPLNNDDGNINPSILNDDPDPTTDDHVINFNFKDDARVEDSIQETVVHLSDKANSEDASQATGHPSDKAKLEDVSQATVLHLPDKAKPDASQAAVAHISNGAKPSVEISLLTIANPFATEIGALSKVVALLQSSKIQKQSASKLSNIENIIVQPVGPSNFLGNQKEPNRLTNSKYLASKTQRKKPAIKLPEWFIPTNFFSSQVSLF